MSEKATLLTSIPPVRAEGAQDKPTPLLSSTPSKPTKSEGKVSLLSQTRDVEATPKVEKAALLKPLQSKAAELQTVETVQAVEAVEAVASESVADEPSSISAFEVVTYASFVLNFLLAGAAAVILFKKAAKLAEERFIVSTKALGIAAVLIMLHGFFATYLYSAHLSDAVSSTPLFLTMAVWVLVGPAVGFITRSLLSRSDKPNRKAAFIDAGIYGLIFFFTACGVSSTIKTNAALMFAALGGFLMIVPIARSLTAFNVAKARHKELNDTSDLILIYGLLILPALLPILAFAHVCGLSGAVTLFLINFITFDFMLVVGLSMIASAAELIPEEAVVEEVAAAPAVSEPAVPELVEGRAQTAASDVAAPKVIAAEPESVAEVSEVAEEPPAAAPEIVGAGNPDDPIIQFLNSAEGMADKPSAPPAAKSARRALPPRKPGRPGITPPAKPGSTPAAKAHNAPSRLKAPAKPKKRF